MNDRQTTAGEFELGLSFAPAESKWSAVAELSFDIDADLPNDGGDDVNFETVTITYQATDALSFTAGHILSYQGLESFDAPNNYFVTYAGDGNTALYSAGYAHGLSADYSAGDIAVGVWAGDAPADDGIDLEFFFGYTGIENLALGAVLAENENGSETLNLMATYEYDAFTFMVESVDSEDGTANDLDVNSITVAYAMGDITLAARVADGTVEDDDGNDEDYEKLSFSLFKTLSDNVSVGVEYSEQELNQVETEQASVELLYVF
jgi:hypothetical protein